MRIPVKYAAWLLPLTAALLLLQGCDKKQQQAQTQTLAPPIVDAPPPQPKSVSKADLPPVVIGDTTPPKPAPETPTPVEPAKKPVHRVKKPVTPPATTTAPATTPAPVQEAANPAPASSVSAIGQLSGGDSGDLRSETIDSINATEKGVNGITRTLSDTETKTAAQIREFLKQAKDALATGDVDGAHTLAMKAKVLLTELNR